METKHRLPQRQIHLDFHTSGLIEGVGADFSAETFAQRLQDAEVESITLFARCHHGWLYFQSERFPDLIHPHLSCPDLLDQQLSACRKRGIRVEVYTTVQWEEQSFLRHPEWAVRDIAGNPVGKDPLQAGFYGNLCINSGYQDFLKEHIREVLEHFHPDGLFLDIVRPISCICPACRAGMEKAGMDISQEGDRNQFARESLDRFRRDISDFVSSIQEGCPVFYNGSHISPSLRSCLKSYGHLEVESLPSGSWGYDHYPLAARCARSLGKEHVGMTGKFHTYWGDFHSLKNRASLEYECFQMLALGGGISIGDQLHPRGRLDAPSYRLIAELFRSAKAKEPWCRDAESLSEVAILNLESWEDEETPDAMVGASRLLQELSIQYDVIDLENDFSSYRLLLLPDRVPDDPRLREKLERYILQGGKLLFSFRSGFFGLDGKDLPAGSAPFCLESLPLRAASSQDPMAGVIDFTNSAAEYLYTESCDLGSWDAGIESPICMYTTGFDVETASDARVRAKRLSSYFHRTWKHFCSHQQAPASRYSPGPAWICGEHCAYFSHPLFSIYRKKAPRWVKDLLGSALGELLPRPMVCHNGPSTLKTSLMHQKSQGRFVLHLLHYIPEKRAEQIEIIEDVIPLHQLELRLALPKELVSARTVPGGEALDLLNEGEEQILTLPLLQGHVMIELAY